MDAAAAIRSARCRAGMSKRELARRARTSPAAIVEYESGRRDPTVATLTRILCATGHRARLDVAPAAGPPDPALAGKRLVQVLDLADHLPRKPASRSLRFPRFPR